MACKVVAHGEEARRVVARRRTGRRPAAHKEEAGGGGSPWRGRGGGEAPAWRATRGGAARRRTTAELEKEGEGDDEWVLRVRSIFFGVEQRHRWRDCWISHPLISFLFFYFVI